MREIPHGTSNGYMNYGCRCDECRLAWKVYYQDYTKGPCPNCGGTLSNRYSHDLCRDCYRKSIEPEHGTESRYVHRSCRCDDCRKAATDARVRRRTLASDGVRRV